MKVRWEEWKRKLKEKMFIQIKNIWYYNVYILKCMKRSTASAKKLSPDDLTRAYRPPGVATPVYELPNELNLHR